MSKTKILMIIPSLDFGGAQRVFHNIARGLGDKFEVIECAFNLNSATRYNTANPLYSLDVPGGKNIIQKIFYFFLRIIRLKKLKAELQVEISISHLEGADYVNILSSRGEKVILCIHGSKIYDNAIKGIDGFFRKKILIPLLYRRADLIISVADGIGNELVEKFKISRKRISVINNGVDYEWISTLSKDEIPSQFRSLFNKPVLITHGRIAFEKRQKLLIDIANHVELKRRINTVIIGDGPMLDYLVDYSRSLGLKTFNQKEELPIEADQLIFFLGYLSNPFPFLSRSDFYAFPSMYEGFPMALLEAMACDLPILATDCPYGPSEILKSKEVQLSDFGILIRQFESVQQMQEVEVWTKLINQLLSNPDLCNTYKKASFERVKFFSSDNIKKWEVALDKIQRNQGID